MYLWTCARNYFTAACILEEKEWCIWRKIKAFRRDENEDFYYGSKQFWFCIVIVIKILKHEQSYQLMCESFFISAILLSSKAYF